ncbi:MAG: ADP-ribosylglycohydrolase family protein [Oscillospiraceae bacterium]|nr:ADP-ribosylglycohydrolase family protein [Oscillospiraceae bacterium]
MEQNAGAYRGCLLGLAVGDAMGFAIDGNSWEEIRSAYGPDGLLGYDLQEQDYAETSSHTQLAAFLCNGLLLSVTRGKADRLRFGRLALQEWSRGQMFHRDQEDSWCWVAKLPCFRRRHCRDSRMEEGLRQDIYGTVDAPRNRNNAPGAITGAVTVGMFYNPDRLAPPQVGVLAAELMALTHGDPTTILSAVVLAYTITGILQEPHIPLIRQFQQAIAVMEGQFREKFSQAEALAGRLQDAITLAQSGSVSPQEGMEALGCRDTAGCLAGAIFACLAGPEDFDRAIITAVNHSGMSSAVGAITGAILGAKLGEAALPEFYLESLECCSQLQTLAEDLVCGTPALGVFDEAWDRKYLQGLPL